MWRPHKLWSLATADFFSGRKWKCLSATCIGLWVSPWQWLVSSHHNPCQCISEMFLSTSIKKISIYTLVLVKMLSILFIVKFVDKYIDRPSSTSLLVLMSMFWLLVASDFFVLFFGFSMSTTCRVANSKGWHHHSQGTHKPPTLQCMDKHGFDAANQAWIT